MKFLWLPQSARRSACSAAPKRGRRLLFRSRAARGGRPARMPLPTRAATLVSLFSSPQYNLSLKMTLGHLKNIICSLGENGSCSASVPLPEPLPCPAPFVPLCAPLARGETSFGWETDGRWLSCWWETLRWPQQCWPGLGCRARHKEFRILASVFLPKLCFNTCNCRAESLANACDTLSVH